MVKSLCLAYSGANGKVYTEIVPDAGKKTLQDIIRRHINLESVIYSDLWGGYKKKPKKEAQTK